MFSAMVFVMSTQGAVAVGHPIEATQVQASMVNHKEQRGFAGPVKSTNQTVVLSATGQVRQTSNQPVIQHVEVFSTGEGEASYRPFAAGWQWNQVLDPSAGYTANGLDSWPEMYADGYGTLWAIYTGTDASYNNDTIYVFYSLDNGENWVHAVSIYSGTSGYHPFVARLSVDRVNNWIYISDVLGSEAGAGQYYPGVMFVTSFQHTGSGNLTNLGTYMCDPEGWGETYGKCAVAPDGSGSGYVYLGGIDWNYGYMDYYRSANHGQTWTYITSLSLGTQYTDVISASPVYGGSGAIISWVDWDDADDADGNTPPEGDYDVYYGVVSSSSEDWHYFNSGGTGFRGVYGISAYGSSIGIPFEEEVSSYDFDIYFLATTDGSSWTQYSHWNNGSAHDTRSATFDVTPQNGGTYYFSYFEDDNGDHYGRPYFYYADVSDLGSWSPWESADGDVYENDHIYANASEHWEIVSPAAQDTGAAWMPHVCWRRTFGATNGGDAWHSWPLPPTNVGEGQTDRSSFAFFNGRAISYSVVGLQEAVLRLYDATGRLVLNRKLQLKDRGEIELSGIAPGAYYYDLRAGQLEATGSAVIR